MNIYQRLAYSAAVVCGCSLAGPLTAEDQQLQSDWLELVKGYRGDSLGAELMEIEEGADPETQEITVAIPKSAMTHPDEIEEVVVIGKMPEKSEPIKIEYEWLQDYDEDNYGLLIRLGRNTNWPIRIYMNSDPGFIR